MVTKNVLHWLIAGFLTGYLSMTVEANMIRKEYPNEQMYWRINFGEQYLINPFIYAIIAVIVFLVMTSFIPEEYQQYWIVGLAMGIIIPSIKLINNYALDVYQVSKMFLFAWDVMIYTLFYVVIIGPLLDNL